MSTQPQQPYKLKKKHFINASYIHSLLNASSIHLINASYIHSPLNAPSIHFCKRIVYSFKKKSRRPFIGPALMSLTHKHNTRITDLTTKSFTYTKSKQPISQHDADPRGHNTNTAKTYVQQQQRSRVHIVIRKMS